jgi:hypothetical protein
MTRLLTALAAASLLVALQPADARAYRFGTTPLNDVLYWSGQTTKRSGRTTNELAAMVAVGLRLGSALGRGRPQDRIPA